MDKTFKITLKSVFFAFLIAAVTIICACGVSPIPHNLRNPLIIVCGIGTAVYILFKQKSMYLTMSVVLALLSAAYLGISVLYSIDKPATFELAVVYICSAVFLLADYPQDFYKKTITAMQVVSIIIAISIVLSVFIDNFMLRYFSFIVNPSNSPDVATAIYQELNWSKAFSGFAREKGEAAFIMNIGIAVYFAKYFSQKKFRFIDVVGIVLLCAALILTGKRMLFLCPIAVGAVLMLLSNKSGKLVKIIPVLFLGICGLIITMGFLPQFSTIFERFANEDSLENLSGRVNLWPYCFEMFGKNPFLGMGIGTYNRYLELNNITINGNYWTAHAHNIYYEFLGELGLIGCVLLFGGLLMIFGKTVLLLRSKEITDLEKFLLIFSFSIQLTCFMYCASGNVLLYKQQIFIWFFVAAISTNITRKYRKLKKDELVNV